MRVLGPDQEAGPSTAIVRCVAAAEGGPSIDVYEAVRFLSDKGYGSPLILRFPDILNNQLQRLQVQEPAVGVLDFQPVAVNLGCPSADDSKVCHSSASHFGSTLSDFTCVVQTGMCRRLTAMRGPCRATGVLRIGHQSVQLPGAWAAPRRACDCCSCVQRSVEDLL
jgi:hypothetical protein